MNTGKPVVVGLGEVLWDVFPDGPQFGGAPANFACSAAAFVSSRNGGTPVMAPSLSDPRSIKT